MDGSITPAATSTAVGTAAVANHITGTAIGGSAYAHGPNDTAIGSNARVNADGSTAVGANTQIAAVATNAVAMGEGAQVTAASGTAIGQGARATAQGAVALGQGAVADRANTVSVGSVGGERQVANVAAGTRATDAVNKGQLDSGVAAANSYTDSRYNAMADSFESYQGDIEDRLRRQNRRLDRQGAMSSAMLNMSASVAGIASQNRIGAGVGFQNGESALSVGYQRAISPRATVTVGGAGGLPACDQPARHRHRGRRAQRRRQLDRRGCRFRLVRRYRIKRGGARCAVAICKARGGGQGPWLGRPTDSHGVMAVPGVAGKDAAHRTAATQRLRRLRQA